MLTKKQLLRQLLFCRNEMKILKKNPRLLVLLLDIAVVNVLLFAKSLVRAAAAILPRCVFYEMGFLCPACGGTRCFSNFVRGSWRAAFGYNPCIFILLALGLILVVCLNLAFLFRLSGAKKMVSRLTDYRLVIGWAVAYGLFGIFRNFL